MRLCWKMMSVWMMVTMMTMSLVTQLSQAERPESKVSQRSTNISNLLNSFQVGYDRRVRPNYGGIPVTVGITLYVLSIGELSEKFMDFTFDMYFRQFWMDPRLGFERSGNQSACNTIDQSHYTCYSITLLTNHIAL